MTQKILEKDGLADLAVASVEVEAVPWKGRVFLDRVAEGRWVLTHVNTLPKVVLNTPDAELHFDEDGGSQLVTGNMVGEVEVAEAADKLHKHLYCNPEIGELFVVQVDGDRTLEHSLDEARAQNKKAAIDVLINKSGAKLTFTTWVFRLHGWKWGACLLCP